MVNRKTASALTIAALLACAVPAKSVTSVVAPVIAQAASKAAPNFPVPDTVEKNTTVRVSSSSDNMNAISAALGQGFEGKYDESKVNVTTKSANDALADVLNDNADVAAISRPLTPEEEAKGLIAVPVRREKIAIVVGKDNTFSNSITGSQFAQIFRGEITDWSEVGGTAGPIRVIDRPDTSDTRQALKPYPVFKASEFKTGSNATQLGDDSTIALAKELGQDGLGYALVGQLEGQSDLKAIQLHKTLPDDPRYPFSQPYSFVYAKAASPAAAAFLGYATGSEGQTALQNADLSGGATAGNGLAPATTGSEPNAGDANADNATTGETNAGATDAAPDEKGTADADTNKTGAEGTVTEGSDAGDTAANGEVGQRNAAGELVDTEGNLINPDGFLIDAEGNLIDAEGKPLPEGAAGIPGVGINLDGISNGIGNAIDGTGNVAGEAANGVGNAVNGVGDLAGRGRWWWLLLPLAGLGLLIWAAGRRGNEEEAGYSATASGTTDDRVRSSFQGNTSNSLLPNVNKPDANLPTVDTNANVNGNLGSIEADGIKTSVGSVGTKVSGMGKAGIAGAAGLAGGAAAGAAGLAGRMKAKAGDAATGVGNISNTAKSGVNNLKGSATAGIDNAKESATGGIGNLRSRVEGGIDETRTNIQGGVQGSIDGMKGSADSAQANLQGSIGGTQENVQGRVGDLRSGVQENMEGIKGNVQSRVNDLKDAASNSVDGAKNSARQDSGWVERAKQRINAASKDVKNTASDIKNDITKRD
ncbi:MAG: substrate-binding domain-containing protein [Phormidesmis sp.]